MNIHLKFVKFDLTRLAIIFIEYKIKLINRFFSYFDEKKDAKAEK